MKSGFFFVFFYVSTSYIVVTVCAIEVLFYAAGLVTRSQLLRAVFPPWKVPAKNLPIAYSINREGDLPVVRSVNSEAPTFTSDGVAKDYYVKDAIPCEARAWGWTGSACCIATSSSSHRCTLTARWSLHRLSSHRLRRIRALMAAQPSIRICSHREDPESRKLRLDRIRIKIIITRLPARPCPRPRHSGFGSSSSLRRNTRTTIKPPLKTEPPP